MTKKGLNVTTIKPRRLIAGNSNSVVLQNVILDVPESKRITIFCLGDVQTGFIPPNKMYEEFIIQLDEALKKGGIIVTHPFLSIMQVDIPKGKMIVSNSPKVDIKTEER